jgi:flagellar motility protein MotE (MotC chaperone)
MATTARTHVLITLGVLFTLGGVMRIMPGTIASAENNPDASTEQGAPVDPQAEAASEPEAVEAIAVSSSEICLTGEAANALARDQASLKERSSSLQQREIDLRAREAELTRQADELAALQQAVEDRWSEMTVNAEADIEHLTRMYSAMKPDQAAGIFNQMDPGFAAGFLRLMQSDQAGMILAGMQTEKAYVVSVKMASKNNDIRNASNTP